MDNMVVILMSQTFMKRKRHGSALFKDYAKLVKTTTLQTSPFCLISAVWYIHPSAISVCPLKTK